MDLGVMIEGQEGLSWDRWRRLIRATEELGFESLFRSDHFFSLSGPHTREALETFISFVLVAENSSRIHFGPLVASMTFRHPALLARQAAQRGVRPGGRFTLGVGPGWRGPEHGAFGVPCPPGGEGGGRLGEGIQVVRALRGEGPERPHHLDALLQPVHAFPHGWE